MIRGRSPALRATAAVAFVLASTSVSGAARADDKACMAAAAMGQELRDDGKLVEAKPFFQQCADTACPAPIPGYCADWLTDLNKKMPSVVFRATDESGRDVADASAEVDGKRTVAVDGRPVDIDPGKHTVKITRAGSKTFEEVIVVAQGEKDRIVLAKLSAAAAQPPIGPTPKKDEPAKSGGVPTASIVAWGIGGVALLSFAGFGLKARVDYDDYEARCGNRCAESERDTVATSVVIADISLVVAVVAAGVGTYLFLTRPTPAAPAKEAAR